MKRFGKNMILLFVGTALASASNAQSTYVLFSDADATAGFHDFYNSANNNYGTAEHMASFDQPGVSGGENGGHALVRFPLASLPPGVVVTSAVLHLHGHGPFGTGVAGAIGNMGDNQSYLERIVEPWEEYLMTWNNQPATTSQNSMIVGPLTDPYGDLVVNVTTLVQDMLNHPDSSFGFELRLVNQTPSAAMVFWAKEAPDATMRPTLTIFTATCNGTPTAGVAAQSTATLVDSTTSFNLNTVSAPSFAGGVSYAWQIDDGNGWMPIGPTANNPNLVATTSFGTATVTGQTATAQYRLIVACSNSGSSDTSAAVTVTNGNPTSCTVSVTYSMTGTPNGVHLSGNNGGDGVYAWDFGDATVDTDSAANVTHVYSNPGTYSACVTYTDSSCTNTACTTVTVAGGSVLSGTVFNDLNNNHMRDASEPGFGGVDVFVNALATVTTQTDSDGHYTFTVPAGEHYVYVMPPTYYAQTLPSGSSAYVVTTAGLDSVPGMDFGLSTTVATVKGKIYVDANANGVWDLGEQGIPGQKIGYPHNGWTNYVYTDANGDYTLMLEPNAYPLTYYMDPALQTAWSLTDTGGNVITVFVDTAGLTYSGNDFGVHIDSSFNDVSVSMWCMNPVPGFVGDAMMTAYNNGFMVNQVTVQLHYDSLLVYQPGESWWWWNDVQPTSVDATNHVVTYSFTILPGDWIYLDAALLCPIGTSLGTVTNSWASIGITGANDSNPANDTTSCQSTVVGSFDPNDKQVNPAGEGPLHAINPNHVDELTYTVRFQNTGTYFATNIVVVDTLDADALDVSSVRLVGSSHPCTLEIVEGNILKAHFDNIMLQDSNANEPESHGFFTFAVDLADGAPDGALVANKAAIYFDFNDPVITNEAFVTLDYHLTTNTVAYANDYSLFPNPVDNCFVLNHSGNGHPATAYEVNDVTGRKMVSGAITTDATVVDVSSLANGAYSVRIMNGDRQVVNKKFVVLHR